MRLNTGPYSGRISLLRHQTLPVPIWTSPINATLLIYRLETFCGPCQKDLMPTQYLSLARFLLALIAYFCYLMAFLPLLVVVLPLDHSFFSIILIWWLVSFHCSHSVNYFLLHSVLYKSASVYFLLPSCAASPLKYMPPHSVLLVNLSSLSLKAQKQLYFCWGLTNEQRVTFITYIPHIAWKHRPWQTKAFMPLGKGPAAALTKQELETEGALSMTEEMPPLMEALNDMYVFYFTFFF